MLPGCNPKLLQSRKSIPSPYSPMNIECTSSKRLGSCSMASGCSASRSIAQKRLMTSRQRPASRLVIAAYERRSLVTRRSSSQDGAEGDVDVVIKKIIGMSPAWNRK